ncbi:ABC transporter permease [Streptomyces avicenniae]|uniref:ABC transporter permease n=1 Tax=Streptomyces avicenniae TaxID=500153 RepID=UPI00069AE6AF|nr:FtsX-like permease family protein [Streptomyces avicenniae]
MSAGLAGRDRADTRPGGAHGPQGPRGGGSTSWRRDLGIGARFALASGRSGRVRTVLTAVGVGLGVAVLLLAASVPAMLTARTDRSDARQIVWNDGPTPGQDAFRFTGADTTYRGQDIGGYWVQPEAGADTTAPPPPGTDRWPAPGELFVSPALDRLLDSDDGALLAERLSGERVGSIGQEGLVGSGELYFYAGTDDLPADSPRSVAWGVSTRGEAIGPTLTLLILIVCVVLLMPVAVFIGTAVRFGGERRDRRLAALRLVGADTAMTRRVAAGEALTGAVLGLLFGVALFFLGRQFLGGITFRGESGYPSDIVPSPALALVIALAVPVSAVVVTLLALRGVVIEPLGVVREAAGRPRRLGWRLVPGVLGLLLLAPLAVTYQAADDLTLVQAAVGVVALLVGVTVVLPWLVERVVARLHRGPVSWQLAVRRLQLSSGPAARAVSGITVAVAGATALSMLLSGVEDEQTFDTGQDPSRAQYEVVAYGLDTAASRRLVSDVGGQPGVDATLGSVNAWGVETDAGMFDFQIADCAALREVVETDSCEPGDVFLTETGRPGGGPEHPDPGQELHFTGEQGSWTVPADARVVPPRLDPSGVESSGVFATPEALDQGTLPDVITRVLVRVDPGEPDAVERIRNVAWGYGFDTAIWNMQSQRTSEEFQRIERGLLVGATGIMLIIGLSMVVSTVEQLRERKRLLSVLVAFGTRRRTLGVSVLWQSAVPVVLGLALASLVGTVLGGLLLAMVDVPVGSWFVFWPMAMAGAGVIAMVTFASLPPLWRLMRADGLRTE